MNPSSTENPSPCDNVTATASGESVTATASGESYNIEFSAPGPTPVVQALIDVMESWNGLPKSVCEKHYEDCKNKCGVVYRLYHQDKKIYTKKHADIVQSYKELQDQNMLLINQNREYEEVISRLKDKQEEILCNYNGLRNRYRRLLSQHVSSIPQLRPVSARNLNPEFANLATLATIVAPPPRRNRRRRRSEFENLLL
jgi:hypothetical protein